MYMKLPDHLSYSALSAYQKCPRSFQLGRVLKAEETPSWYFAVGTAVHQFVEIHLQGGSPDVEQLFMGEVERLMEIEPDTHTWAHAGPDTDPVVEEKALQQAQACAERAIVLLDEIDVWEVELDVSGMLPGCDMPIMGFVDIVGEHRKHGPIIGDWKTGKGRPKNALQLETYHALLHGPDQIAKARRWSAKAGAGFKGLWLMVHPEAAKNPRPIEFKETPVSMGNMYGDMARAIRKEVFPARIRKWECDHCFQAVNCIVASGPTARAKYYEEIREGK